MKLGYIHSNREEQTRVMQVLKMTSESVALDELGIGRVSVMLLQTVCFPEYLPCKST